MNAMIKTKDEIEKMRIAGKRAAEVLEMIEPYVVPGVTTEKLDEICHDYIVNVQKATSACLGYQPSSKFPPYPKSICTSVNHQICHGIPGPKALKDGDIVNIDVTVIVDGFHGDTSKMFLVGTPSVMAKRLCEVAQTCMYLGIQSVKAGAHLGDIGAAIQKYAHQHRYSVVEDYCGHGIGRKFHEEPSVLHYGKAGTGIELQEGMIFTIEPMINVGKKETRLLPDGWTVTTRDHSLSAQWEHTILVTKTGFEVLTLRTGEKLGSQ